MFKRANGLRTCSRQRFLRLSPPVNVVRFVRSSLNGCRLGTAEKRQFRTRAAGEALESGMGYRPPLLGSLVNDERRRL